MRTFVSAVYIEMEEEGENPRKLSSCKWIKSPTINQSNRRRKKLLLVEREALHCYVVRSSLVQTRKAGAGCHWGLKMQHLQQHVSVPARRTDEGRKKMVQNAGIQTVSSHVERTFRGEGEAHILRNFVFAAKEKNEVSIV